MDFDISPRALSYFHRAGFDPRRRVPVDPAVPRDHPAWEVLSLLGGLHVGVDGSDEMLEGIRSDIAFGHTQPYGEIQEWERLLRMRLIGIAQTHQRDALLYLSDDERFFDLSGMHDAMGFHGTGFSDAIDNLLFGQSMPMIRPDQTSVSWYGIVYEPDDSRLYRYNDVGR